MGSHCGQANIAIFLCILAVVLAEQATGTTTTTQAPPTKKELKIAAFNVQVFGVTKMKKTEVVEVLVRIIRRYDVILIQEIRDASGEAIIELLEEINDAQEHNYEITLSERLGRTSSKEQYAFLYRSGIGLDVVSTYQYPDKADKFERPPFAILLKIPNSDIEQMALIAIHTSPKEAEAEIDALVDVRLAVMKQWRINNVLIMGDFNAASPYTTKTEMAKIRLRDSKYLWLIPDDMDTTISRSDSAYDRFVVTGKELTNSIVPDSAKTFRFNEAYKLDLEESKDVSDHFPIEFAIKLGTSGSTSAGNRKRGFISRVKEFARGLFSSDHHEL